MARLVMCVKLNRELPGLEDAPWPDELGDRIYDRVSEEAWKLWLEHQKMLLNEYRLNAATPEAYELLHKQCEEFFFGEGAQLPPDYVAPRAKG
ncbi:MAG: oxidative damage protection protein [Deltaproteobacteria bacterium]